MQILSTRRAVAVTLMLAMFSMLLPQGVAHANGDDRERTLVIGKVSLNPKKHYNYLKPMADYVVARMGDLGIDRVEVLMAKNNRQMVSYLKRGKVDWVTETVFSAIEFEEKAGAEPIALKHKKGVGEYHTVFFARKDSGIRGFDDLRGKVIAFQDAGSTSGFFVPAAILLKAGLNLVELDSPRERVSDDEVGYVFAKEEINMSTWVHKGLVDAGAFSNLDWAKDDHTPDQFRQSLVLFHEDQPYPRAIELVRAGLRPEVKQRLREILLDSHADPAAKAALKAYQKTTRFEPIDARIRAQIDRSRGVMDIVKDGLDR